MTPTETRSLHTAVARVFGAYESHCVTPDANTLFYTLNGLHSLSDRLEASAKIDLLGFQEFVALKALRNLTHHQEEVRSNVRVVDSPVYSDLMVLCLVRRDQVERAIENTYKKWLDSTRSACQDVFHWYGPAVNINPALFNLMARTYELLDVRGLLPQDDALESFAQSWDQETASGESHFVDGRLSGRACDITSVLAALVADLPEP